MSINHPLTNITFARAEPSLDYFQHLKLHAHVFVVFVLSPSPQCQNIGLGGGGGGEQINMQLLIPIVFTYTYHKKTHNQPSKSRQIYHTWILSDCNTSKKSKTQKSHLGFSPISFSPKEMSTEKTPSDLTFNCMLSHFVSCNEAVTPPNKKI